MVAAGKWVSVLSTGMSLGEQAPVPDRPAATLYQSTAPFLSGTAFALRYTLACLCLSFSSYSAPVRSRTVPMLSTVESSCLGLRENTLNSFNSIEWTSLIQLLYVLRRLMNIFWVASAQRAMPLLPYPWTDMDTFIRVAGRALCSTVGGWKMTQSAFHSFLPIFFCSTGLFSIYMALFIPATSVCSLGSVPRGGRWADN